MSMGKPPQPTAPWRMLIFRVHCVVTQRWMKIRVPFNWFWFGDQEYGTPEIESGTIAASNPTPPAMGPRLPAGVPAPLDAGSVPEEDLQPIPRAQIRQGAPTQGEEIVDIRERLRQIEGRQMELQMGDDSKRGGR